LFAASFFTNKLKSFIDDRFVAAVFVDAKNNLSLYSSFSIMSIGVESNLTILLLAS